MPASQQHQQLPDAVHDRYSPLVWLKLLDWDGQGCQVQGMV
jgi:hypothetical protein